jgi:hypothetical protein
VTQEEKQCLDMGHHRTVRTAATGTPFFRGAHGEICERVVVHCACGLSAPTILASRGDSDYKVIPDPPARWKLNSKGFAEAVP